MRALTTLTALSFPTAAIALVTLTDLTLPPGRAPAPANVIQPNDNVRSAGRERNDVLELSLVVDTGRWQPADDRPAVAAAAFREEGKPLQTPAPMIRVKSGTELRVSLRNTLTLPLYVWGLVTRPTTDSAPVRVEPGATHRFRFAAGEPGTYFYFARTDTNLRDPPKWDGQLNGALIVERPGTRRPLHERVFVISLMETLPDSAATDSIHKVGIWYPAINGRSWPHTERLTLSIGDRAAWRWINATDRAHPMHLHGFFFTVNAKGTWRRDTIFAEADRPLAVTELMTIRSTMDMTWQPERVGNWLMHCHMMPHIMPFWIIPGQKIPAMDTHANHAEQAMAGLVIGITVRPRTGEPPPSSELMPLARQLRLVAQEGVAGDGKRAVSYILQQGDEPRPDSVLAPGLPIVLRKNEPVTITVVNKLKEPTSIHWHGLELDSYYDGVAGWSGADRRLAPQIAPGDSFAVRLTPPRTGTYMYHSHMDEHEQLVHGAYGPLIVIEPFERWTPDTDRTFVIGSQFANDKEQLLLNGQPLPDTLRLRAGTRYRLRWMNIGFVAVQRVSFLRDSSALEQWSPLAKDGAPLPASRAKPRPARFVFGVGETYDFTYTPGDVGTRRITIATNRRDSLWLTLPVKVE